MPERKRRNVLIEGEKLRGADKLRRIPMKVVPTVELPEKPPWLRVRIPVSPRIAE
ncbi:MAG: lipoyl synthase, partial [Gammaproteobacteria bacterium]|nr:lipoyl synthase [Gammaproteobacteria bacterium]